MNELISRKTDHEDINMKVRGKQSRKEYYEKALELDGKILELLGDKSVKEEQILNQLIKEDYLKSDLMRRIYLLNRRGLIKRGWRYSSGKRVVSIEKIPERIK